MADEPEDPSTTAAANEHGELLIDLAGDSDGQNFPEDEDNINVNSGVVLNANFTLTLQTIEDHVVFKVALAMLNKHKYLNLEEKKKMVGFIKESIGKGACLPVNCDIHGMTNIGIRILSDVFQCILTASSRQINVEFLATRISQVYTIMMLCIDAARLKQLLAQEPIVAPPIADSKKTRSKKKKRKVDNRITQVVQSSGSEGEGV